MTEHYMYYYTLYLIKDVIKGGIENIWLFIPFGAGLWKMMKQKRVLLVLLISLFFSLVIETTQYFTGLGIAEFVDAFNNTLDGVIGSLLAEEIVQLKSKRDDLQLVQGKEHQETRHLPLLCLQYHS